MVFSAGGAKGDPFHSGVIAAIAEHTGFDSRDAELMVGTSAGSFTTTALRAGLSPIDAEARHLGRELSAEGNAIVDRIVTPYSEPEIERSPHPSALRMTLNSILPPWKIDPARFTYGLLPEGKRSGASIATRIDELLPDGWPKRPTWIVAVRTNDGRRIVFGRDDVTGTVGQATQASAAIPAFYTPVRIGDRSYVDGALHSSTNADLVTTLGFDLVIISSVKTATPDTRSWRLDPERSWFSNKLDNELAEIRSTGTLAIVIEPDDTQLELLSSGERADACVAGRLAAERVLATSEGAGLRSIVELAS